MASGSRAVLFDLDDTLTLRRACVTSFASIFASEFEARLERIAIEQLIPLLIEIDQGGYNPRRGEELRERLAWRDAPSAALLEEHWLRRFPDAVVPGPGLYAVLGALAEAGLRLGVVTNGGARSQNRKIDRLGLRERLQAVIVSEAVGCKKPDPKIFEIACRELGGLAAGDCWFVGDHPENDVRGAAAFGMTAVWITHGVDGHAWPADAPKPAHRISALSELLPLLGLAALPEVV